MHIFFYIKQLKKHIYAYTSIMMNSIRYFSNYVTDGTNVYSKNRRFPVEPRIHPEGFKQYFLRQDNGDVKFVSQKMIDNLTIKLARSNTRAKTVTHIPSGKIYVSMKEACDTHKISMAKLKACKDFEIV